MEEPKTKKTFQGREISHDTCEVRYRGLLILVFSCDAQVIEKDERCWGAFQRTLGMNRSAREILSEGFSGMSDMFKDGILEWEAS